MRASSSGPPPAAERVRVAAVAEDRSPWRNEIKVLFASLRALGGSLAAAQAVAYFVRAVERETEAFLRELDVDVRVVAPVREDAPYANVLRMWEEPEAYDWLVALDADVAVAGDFARHLFGESLLGRVPPKTALTLEEWRELHELFGVELPRERYLTSLRLEETIPYFHNAVLISPSALVDEIRERWLFFVDALLEERERLPPTMIRRSLWRRNQFSLGLTLSSARIPHRLLPLEMNFTQQIDPSWRPEEVDPRLLHYRHRLNDDLTLRPWRFPKADAAVRRVNRALDPYFGRRRLGASHAVRRQLIRRGNGPR